MASYGEEEKRGRELIIFLWLVLRKKTLKNLKKTKDGEKLIRFYTEKCKLLHNIGPEKVRSR